MQTNLQPPDTTANLIDKRERLSDAEIAAGFAPIREPIFNALAELDLAIAHATVILRELWERRDQIIAGHCRRKSPRPVRIFPMPPLEIVSISYADESSAAAPLRKVS